MLTHTVLGTSGELPAANSWIQVVVAVVALVNTLLLSLLHSRAYRRDGWRGIGGRSGRRSTRIRSEGRACVDLLEEEEEDGG